MQEIITSRQNPRVREICSLSEKKYRQRTGLFRFDGIKLLIEALENGVCIETVVLRVPMSESTSKVIDAFLVSGRLCEEQILPVDGSVFEKISEERSPEGVLTVAKQPSALHRVCGAEEGAEAMTRDAALLLAESLRDPGNLGTVMRSCAALGIDCLILTDDCADLYNPKTVRSAMGALFRLPTITVSCDELEELIRRLRRQGRRVFATALRRDARSIGSFHLQTGDCFVIGNEGHGLSERVVEASDGAAIIPMREGNESLNAAAAAAICIWETVRASSDHAVRRKELDG